MRKKKEVLGKRKALAMVMLVGILITIILVGLFFLFIKKGIKLLAP